MISFIKRLGRGAWFAPDSASEESFQQELGSQQWLWVLGSVCAVHRIAFDPGLIAKQFPPPRTVAGLLEALHALGLEVRPGKLGRSPLADTEFPALAWLREPPRRTAESGGGNTIEPVLLVKSSGGRLLYFRAGAQSPDTIALEEAPAHFSGALLTVHKLPPKVEEASDAAQAHAPKPFGFRWFVPELLKHKRIWRDVLLASLAVQVLALATPLFTQVIIDKIIVHHTQSTLIAVAFGLGMFLIFSAALSWVRQYLVLHTGNRIDAVLGSQVFSHLLRLPMSYFERRPTGVVISRLHAVETIREFLSGAAISLLLDLPFLLIFLAIMFAYSWQLSLIAAAGLGLVCLLSLAVTPAFRNRLNQQFLVGARNQAFVTEYISGMATVKSLQMEPTVGRQYGELLAHFLHAGFRTKTLANTYNTLANALEQTMTLAILLVGALIVMQSDGFTVGMLVAFQMFASRLSQPLLRLAGLWQELQQAHIAVKRLGDVMNAPQEPYSIIPAREHKAHGRIELEGVSFRYDKDRPYLYRDLNLSIVPGQCIALMGPSGSGKSTLAKLLQGFVWAQEGSIRIDGHDTRHLSANELRNHFGVVPQETVLFSGTLYDNLQLANSQASFEDLVQACKFAEIHRFIESLPQGYQTQIGEHGVGLSGGQRQRIAIARALLKRPKILIFDEATSGLDEDTAAQLAQTINTLRGQVTLIFIAHRLPTGLQVDSTVQIGTPSIACQSEPGVRPA